MDISDVERRFTELGAGDDAAFEAMAAVVWEHQRRHNPVVAAYARTARHLPVEAFKHAPLTTFPPEAAERVFESSGTGRGTPSRHYVRRLSVYERAASRHFESVFGAGPFTLVAHLPRYAERGARSSLLYMAEVLVARYGNAASGFFLDDAGLLHRAAAHSEATGEPLVLLGAAFGLLDLVEAGAPVLPASTRVVETGGMKTTRREIDRHTLHHRLAEGFGLPRASIWSEYGMCELLSQCYTRGGAVFFPPPWMRFEIRDPEDPRREVAEGVPGALALTDLANLYSVASILTEDRAVRVGEGFEVLGRLSLAELRGCNFLLERRETG